MGSAWLAARRPLLAQPFLAERLRTVPDRYPRDRMLAAIDLATAHLLAGDVDAACAATEQACETATHVSSQRIGDRLTTLIDQLRRHPSRHPRIRAIIERVDHAPDPT